jgi:signal transduction histidine kinase
MNNLTPPRIDGRVLGVLGIVLALVCWAALLLLRVLVFGLPLTPANILVELILVAAGSALFWFWIVATLNRQNAEVRLQAERLAALHAATTALTTEHELRPVLQKVVDLSRELIHARYGALGILSEEGDQIGQFIASGISPSAQAQIGRFPGGHGLLGASLFQGETVRVADIAADERSSGLPTHHPDMHSFLSVPITSKGRIFGNLYLADKLAQGDHRSANQPDDHVEFTTEDQELLEMFAAQAAIAIEDAQLHRATRQVAVMRERERIGMDLHDGVIQSIYAIGLMLDDTAHRLDSDTELAEERIANAITGLNSVIRNIRAYIHDLRSPDFSDKSLESGVEELIREMEAYSVLEVTSDIEADAAENMSQNQVAELLYIVQEALTNIRRHSHASAAHIVARFEEDNLLLTIEDDGVGFAQDALGDHGGHGLRNMAQRALQSQGTLELNTAPGSGTRITVRIPAKVAVSSS